MSPTFNLFEKLVDLSTTIYSFGTELINLFFTDVAEVFPDLIPNLSAIGTIIPPVQAVADALTDVSLLEFSLGSGLVVWITWTLIKWLLPTS